MNNKKCFVGIAYSILAMAFVFILAGCQEKHEHTYSDWIFTKDPTCDESGLKMKYCTECNYTVYEVVAAHEHEYEKTVIEPTCTENGYDLYCCKYCGKKYTENETEATGHDYVQDTIIDVTCTQNGFESYTCSKCGDTYYKKVEMLEHTVVTDAAKEPTCTEDGLTEGSHCSVCGTVLVKQEIISKLGHEVVTDAKVDPTFESEGLTEGSHCSRCNEVLVKQEAIPKLIYSDYAYEINFEYDTSALSVEWFNTNDMTGDGTYSDTGYSRDSSTGDLLKNGSGQINFIIHPASDDILADSIVIEGNYKNLKDSSDTGVDNGYRITKISSDLNVKIVTYKKSEIEGSDMITDLGKSVDGNTATFTWKELINIDYVKVEIENGSSENVDGGLLKYSLTMSENTAYNLTFTPYYNDSISGKAMTATVSYMPGVASVSYTTVEITTEDNVLPTCDYVRATIYGTIGASITNANYVNSIVKIYNDGGTLVYDSTTSPANVSTYTGAKIKIRGNTSAYPNKKPFKIKLNQAADLLSSFLGRTDSSYKDREWLLLNTGQALNFAVGRSISATVRDGDEWEPNFVYTKLYMNGDYLGMYILSESVNGDREGVSEDGYVVERDAYWWNEDLSFTGAGYYDVPCFRFTFKYPDTDNITEGDDTYNYIQNYIRNFETLLTNHDLACLDLIDVTSFAKWLLIHDFMATWDCGGSNMLYYKEDSTDATLLKNGPNWDFDDIFRNGTDSFARIHTDTAYYYFHLLELAPFRNVYNQLFATYSSKIVSALENDLSKYNNAAYDTLTYYENCRWGTACDIYTNQYTDDISYMTTHVAWLAANI